MLNALTPRAILAWINQDYVEVIKQAPDKNNPGQLSLQIVTPERSYYIGGLTSEEVENLAKELGE